MRTDAAICTGYEFPPLLRFDVRQAHHLGATWDKVLERSRRALDMGVSGVKTTIPYHLQILKTPEFRAAKFDTWFVEHHPN